MSEKMNFWETQPPRTVPATTALVELIGGLETQIAIVVAILFTRTALPSITSVLSGDAPGTEGAMALGVLLLALFFVAFMGWRHWRRLQILRTGPATVALVVDKRNTLMRINETYVHAITFAFDSDTGAEKAVLRTINPEDLKTESWYRILYDPKRPRRILAEAFDRKRYPARADGTLQDRPLRLAVSAILPAIAMFWPM